MNELQMLTVRQIAFVLARLIARMGDEPTVGSYGTFLPTWAEEVILIYDNCKCWQSTESLVSWQGWLPEWEANLS